MYGLEVQEVRKPGLLDKLLGKKSVESAVLEVQNQLANQPILQMYDDEVIKQLQRYGLTREQARAELAALYRKIHKYFARDGSITDADREQLERLALLFGFPSDFTEELNTRLANGAG